MLCGCSGEPESSKKDLIVYTDYTEKWRIQWEIPPSIKKEYCEAIYLKNNETGSSKRISTYDYNTSAVFSVDGTLIAYLSGNYELKIYNIKKGSTKTYNTDETWRLALGWLPDNKSVVYSTDNQIVIHNILDDSKKSFPIKGAEDVSPSPDGRFLSYWRREGKDENDADGWIFYLLNLSDGTTVSFGKKNDGRGVVGKGHWKSDSTRFLIMIFEVDKNNDRSDIKYRWFDLDLEELEFPDSNPMVVQQWRFPWNSEMNFGITINLNLEK